MKKILVLLLVIVIAILIPISCKKEIFKGTGPSTKTGEAVKKQLKFAISNPGIEAIWLQCAQGFVDYCKENGIECTVIQNQKPLDALEQVENVRQMISKEYDAIGMIVSDAKICIDAVEACKKAGIPIGTPTAEVAIPRFAANAPEVVIQGGNYYPARSLGEYCSKLLNGKGNVVTISGIPGIDASEQREKGFVDGLAKGIKHLEHQAAMWDSTKAYNIMTDYLNKYDKIDAVFGGFDDGALACYEAIKAAGRLDDGILIFGFDAVPAALEALAANKIHGTILQDVYNMAYLCAAGLHRHTTFARAQRSWTDVEFKLVTKENLVQLFPEYKDKIQK